MEALRVSSSCLLNLGLLHNTALFTDLDLEELLEDEDAEDVDGQVSFSSLV